MLLLYMLGVIATITAPSTPLWRQLVISSVGVLLGTFCAGQVIWKGTVTVWCWERKGALATLFLAFGALLIVISAWGLITAVFRW
jgi:hypothetical protein